MTDFLVLFVDDEPLTRRITTRLLSRHCQVLEADGGEMALDILSRKSGEISVIITDMKMDDMSGMVLIEKVGEEYPNIPVIASTGDLSNYDFDALIAAGKLFASIEKPWNFDAALALIESAVGRNKD